MTSLETSLLEAWHAQAHAAFNRYLDEHRSLDPIDAERMKPAFLDGFTAAARPPLPEDVGKTPVVPLNPPEIIELGLRLLPFVAAFGKHGCIAPGDMMVALGIVITTIGRKMHPSFSHLQVFQIYTAEMPLIFNTLDLMQASPGETRH